MNLKKFFLVGIAIIIMIISNNSLFAFTDEGTQILNKEKIVKEYRVLDSETSVFLNYIENSIKNNKDIYNYSTYTKVSDEKNMILKEKQEFYENLEFNDIEKIKSFYGEKRIYEDLEYQGVLDNLNIKIDAIDNGVHEEIWEIKEDFKNYSINELDTIPKEITKYGYTYYLTDCIFETSKTEKIDGVDVPLSYSGTKIYQTVATIKNPDTYNISLIYSGNVERKDKVSIYTVEYNYMPLKEGIVISGIGIAILIIYYFLRGNTKVYNYSKGKYKLIKKVNLSNKKNIIDLTNKLYKIDTNMYKLKLNKSTYKKIKNKIVNIKINSVSKGIHLNNREIDFKM